MKRLLLLHPAAYPSNQEASLTPDNAEDKVDGHAGPTQEEESVAAAAAAVKASLQRERLGQARVDAEAALHRVLEGISDAQAKVLLAGHVLKEEAVGGTRKVFGECKSALETAIGRLLLSVVSMEVLLRLLDSSLFDGSLRTAYTGLAACPRVYMRRFKTFLFNNKEQVEAIHMCTCCAHVSWT